MLNTKQGMVLKAAYYYLLEGIWSLLPFKWKFILWDKGKNAFAMLEACSAWTWEVLSALHGNPLNPVPAAVSPYRNTSCGEHVLVFVGYHSVQCCQILWFLSQVSWYFLKPQMVESDEYVKITASIWKEKCLTLSLKGEVSVLKCQTTEKTHKSLKFLWW